MRGRDRRERLVEDAPQQVAERGERQRRLGQGGPARADPERPGPGRFDGAGPQRALADARGALDEQGRGACGHVVQEPVEDRSLTVPADQPIGVAGGERAAASNGAVADYGRADQSQLRHGNPAGGPIH